jgi:hypothetical protein
MRNRILVAASFLSVGMFEAYVNFADAATLRSACLDKDSPGYQYAHASASIISEFLMQLAPWAFAALVAAIYAKKNVYLIFSVVLAAMNAVWAAITLSDIDSYYANCWKRIGAPGEAMLILWAGTVLLLIGVTLFLGGFDILKIAITRLRRRRA